MTIDTAKLRELAQAATPGPWVVDDTKVDLLASNPECPDEWFCFGGASQPANAAYIAAAHPAAVLALLDENARLRKAFHTLAGLSNELSWNVRTRTYADRMQRIISAALSGGAA